MNKVKLSKKAEDALLAAENRQGAKIRTDTDTQWELIDAGLFGKKGGLTRQGTIVRQRIMDARLDEAFG